jgi:hypothetical protein
MTEAVFQFKAIKQKLNRQDQKAEFEAKEEAQRQTYAGLYGVMVPLFSLAHPEWPYAGTPHEWRLRLSRTPLIVKV